MPDLQPSFSFTGIINALQNLTQVMGKLTTTISGSFISLAGDNTFTGTDTFKLPPVINAGALGTATLLPEGYLSKQVSQTGIGNGNDTTEDTLFTYSLPANALDAAGRGLLIRAFGSLANNAHGKTVRLYFGGVVFTSGALTTANAGWRADLLVYRTGVGAQIAIGRATVNGLAPILSLPLAGSEIDTGAITIKVTGQTAVASANDVVANGLLVEYQN